MDELLRRAVGRATELRKVERRIAIERQIVRSAIKDLLAAGYEITVDDGEAVVLRDSTKANAIFAAMFSTDEDILRVDKVGAKASFVHFVYGNDGFDVIADYGVSLEPVLAKTNRLAELLESRNG